MREAAAYTEEQNYQDALRLANLFKAIVENPAVVIARINGAAFGGGCGLVAAADVAVASDNALFAFSEVRLGLVPATISPFVLPKIGSGNARALFTTGEAFKADRALRIGLIHEVVSAEDLDQAVNKKIKAILAAGPQAIATSKIISQGAPMDLETAARVLARARAGDEGKEGVAAFLEKRKAGFVAEL
jgi:enoyl-CoA hydratase/carnithine racemase